MKHFNYVVTVEQNGKYFSYPIKATENDNLRTYFNKIENAILIFPVATEKQANEEAARENLRYTENGNNLY